MDAASSILLLLFLLLLLLLLLLTTKGRSSLNLRRPLRLPVIGHLHLLQRPLHRSLARLSDRYGPVLLLHFGSRPILLVSSPAAAEECFKIHDVSFGNRPLLLSGKHFNYDGTTLVVTPYGPRWRDLRRVVTVELLSTARLSAFAQLRAVKVRSILQNLFSASPSRDDWFEVRNMRSRFMEVTMHILIEMILGRRLGEEKVRRFAVLIGEIFHMSNMGSLEDFLPFLRWLGLNDLNKRMSELQKEVDGSLQEMVDTRRRERMEVKEGDCDPKKSLVDAMLSLQDEDPQFYTDTIVKGMIEVLVLGGTDTSAATAEWAMALLLNHPQSLEKLHHEIEVHVGHQRIVSDSDLPNLRFLNYVIKETLRLFPPGPFLVPRESIVECEVAGVAVPRGTMLLVNAYKLHRDPEVWTDPTEFQPERFAKLERKTTTATGKLGEGFKYVPFGGGRRRCPGEGLAVRSVGLMLASLIQCFAWKRAGEEEVDLSEADGLSMPMANPLQALCKPRSTMIDVLSEL